MAATSQENFISITEREKEAASSSRSLELTENGFQWMSPVLFVSILPLFLRIGSPFLCAISLDCPCIRHYLRHLSALSSIYYVIEIGRLGFN